MEERIETEIRGVNTGEVEITWYVRKDIMKKDGKPDVRCSFHSICISPEEVKKINEELVKAKKWLKEE
jgi:hypothetical protein